MLSYPPAPRNAREIELALEPMKALLHGRKHAYISHPITGGRRFVEWYSAVGKTLAPDSPEYHTGRFHAVMRPNLEEAGQFLAQVTAQGAEAFIHPGAVLQMPGWAEEEFCYFWGQVVQRYTRLVLFLDGWAYSAGCAYEFLIAAQNQIPVADQQGQPISIIDGIEKIAEASALMQCREIDNRFLRAIVAELNRLLA